MELDEPEVTPIHPKSKEETAGFIWLLYTNTLHGQVYSPHHHVDFWINHIKRLATMSLFRTSATYLSLITHPSHHPAQYIST